MKTAAQTAAKKTAAKKTAAKKTAAQPVQIEAKPDYLEAYNAIHAALQKRIQYARDIESAGKENEIKSAVSCIDEKTFAIVFEKMKQTDWFSIASKINICDKKENKIEFLSYKTVQKLGYTLQDIAQGFFPRNNNVRIALRAMLKHDNFLTVTEMIAAQSKGYRENANLYKIREGVASMGGFTEGTASSQTGQVRALIQALGLATVRKYGRDDAAKLNEGAVKFLNELTLSRQS